MKLPKDLKNLNLTKEEFESLTEEEQKKVLFELPSTDASFYTEENPETNLDFSELPCVINGILIY